jgi:hypothetical protein
VRRSARRRTSRRVSTIITPAAAAMPVACPDGYEKLVSVVIGSGQTGRLRCSNPFRKYVVSEAAIITPIIHTAARVCLRVARSTAVIVV